MKLSIIEKEEKVTIYTINCPVIRKEVTIEYCSGCSYNKLIDYGKNVIECGFIHENNTPA